MKPFEGNQFEIFNIKLQKLPYNNNNNEKLDLKNLIRHDHLKTEEKLNSKNINNST